MDQEKIFLDDKAMHDMSQSIYLREQKKSDEQEQFNNWKMEKFLPTFLQNRGGEGLSGDQFTAAQDQKSM